MNAGRRSFVASILAAPLVARRRGVGRVQSRDHVVVIGAGAFGGWIALSLLRAGARVTLIDAWGAGNSRASSGGETRVIRGVYGGEPTYTAMVAEAFRLWREAEQRWQRQLYFRTGALWMFEGDDAYARSSIEPLRAVGLTTHVLTPADAARRFPQVRFDGVRTVFLEEEAGYLLARTACELVREAVVREGGEYRVAWVKPGRSDGRRLDGIQLSDGSTVTADRYVFACGPWMGRVFPDVVGRRIVATRQEVYFFGVPAGNSQFDAPNLPVWVNSDSRLFYGIPGNERRGFKLADDTLGPEVNPTTLARVPSPASLTRARGFLRRRFPALAEAPVVEARVCQYERSSDGHFLIDRHPGFDNVWLVGGGSGHGFKMGPALGEHAAAVVQGRRSVNPLFGYERLRNAAPPSLPRL